MEERKYSSIIKVPKEGSGIKYIGILEKRKAYKRSEVSVEESNSNLNISVNADDLNALKASTNGILRELQLIYKVQAIGKKGNANARRNLQKQPQKQARIKNSKNAA
jgi:tRNA threonylcarbamoyladenosine modification (KEOPS) complex  Pcc1 subunit